MQKSLCILLLLFCFICPALNQSLEQIDSLKKSTQLHTDSTKVKVYLDLADYYLNFNISLDSFQFYAQKGLDYANQINYQKGSLEATYRLGAATGMKSEYGKSNKYFERLLEAAKQENQARYIAIAYNGLGNNFWKANQLTSALDYFLEAAKMAELANNKDFLPTAYLNIGVIQGSINEHEKAIQYSKKALGLIGQSLNSKQQFIAVDLHFNLAESFHSIGQLDSARYYSLSGIKKSKAIQYTYGENLFLTQLAQIELQAKNYPLAASFAQQFLNAQGKENPEDFDLIITAFGRLAKANVHRNDFKAALAAVDSALVYANKCEAFFCQKKAMEAAIYLYEYMGDFKKAFQFQKKYQQFNDSIINQEKQSQLQILNSFYESEKKERKLSQLSREYEAQAFKIRRRNLLIAGLAAFGVLGLFTLYFYYQQRMLKAKQTIHEAEQRLLRLQINPHFLFNALSSIQTYLFNKEDTHKAIHYLSRFAELMRQVLEYSRETYISLEDEIHTLENYLSLQQLRYNHSFDYQIVVEPGINRWETQIPPIMAQPFVENAIEHGKVHLIENGFIKVQFKEEEEQLVLMVEDNGIGRHEARKVAAKKRYKSLATSITLDRIQVLSSLARRKFSFNIVDLPERGTRVIFHFPIVKPFI